LITAINPSARYSGGGVVGGIVGIVGIVGGALVAGDDAPPVEAGASHDVDDADDAAELDIVAAIGLVARLPLLTAVLFVILAVVTKAVMPRMARMASVRFTRKGLIAIPWRYCVLVCCMIGEKLKRLGGGTDRWGEKCQTPI